MVLKSEKWQGDADVLNNVHCYIWLFQMVEAVWLKERRYGLRENLEG